MTTAPMPAAPTREPAVHPGTRPAPRQPWRPTPETLNPERLCPAQRDRIVRGI